MDHFYIFLFLALMCFFSLGTPISYLSFGLIIVLAIYSWSLGMWAGVLLTIGSLFLLMVVWAFVYAIIDTSCDMREACKTDAYWNAKVKYDRFWKSDISKIARHRMSPPQN